MDLILPGASTRRTLARAERHRQSSGSRLPVRWTAPQTVRSVEPLEGVPVERSMWLRQEPDVERHIRFMEEEFRRGFSLIDRIDRPAVSLFGSARTPRDHP